MHPRLAAAALMVWGALCSACNSSGQTGSPSCLAVVSCACATLISRVPVVAEVVATDSETTALRIDRLMDRGPSFTPETQGFRVSDVVHGTPFVPDECQAWLPPVVSAGDHVFAAIEGRVPVCTDPLVCDAAADCPEGGEQSCGLSCREGPSCVAERDRALAGPFQFVLAPPGDPVDFGEGNRVPFTEVADWSQCSTKYPPKSVPPCSDVVQSNACAVSRLSAASGPSSFCTLWGIGAFALRSGRRRPRC